MKFLMVSPPVVVACLLAIVEASNTTTSPVGTVAPSTDDDRDQWPKAALDALKTNESSPQTPAPDEIQGRTSPLPVFLARRPAPRSHQQAPSSAVFKSIQIPSILCAESYPHHGVEAQSSAPPYLIELNATHYIPGDVIEVRIYSDDALQLFKGFQLRAQRLQDDTEVPVGEFFDYRQDAKGQRWYPEKPKAYNCLTNTDSDDKTEIMTLWRAPETSVGDIMFSALVLQDYETFWVTGIERRLNASQVSEDPINPSSVQTWFRIIDIHSCGITKGCFKYPAGCQDYECQYFVTWEANENQKKATFELFGDAKSFLSLGFSEDETIGDDNTFTCVYTKDKKNLQHGYNFGRTYIRHRQMGLRSVEMTRDGNRLYCRFERPFSVYVADMEGLGGGDDLYNKTFDLRNEAFLLVTHGDVYPGTTVPREHNALPIRSRKKINFLEADEVSGRSLTPSHVAHMSLGTLARLVITGIAIVIPRFFKHPLSKIGRKERPLWANISRGLLIVIICVNGAAIILLGVKIGWTKYAELHAYVGLACMGGTILLLCTGGATSCLTGKAQTRMWWVHDVLGYIVAILAVTTIFLGLRVEVVLPWVRQRVQPLIVGWLLFHLLIYIIYLISERNKEPEPVMADGGDAGVAMTARGQKAVPVVTASETSYRFEWALFITYCVLSMTFFIIVLIYFCLA